MGKKEKLIDNLRNDIYCRIAPSKISGVGVIAIRDIPKNTDPFRLTDGKCMKYKSINIDETELKNIDPEIKKMLNDFLGDPTSNKNKYFVPELGLNSIDISFYMNHSKNNNILIKYEKDCEYFTFITKRNIKKGEELTINYSNYQ